MKTAQLKVIKRYQNRKLYDTKDSCYVTLEDIAEMVKAGEEVQIIENSSKEDITSLTLAQIIFEEQKRKSSSFPQDTFTELIRSGGGVLKEIVSKTLETGVRELGHVVDNHMKPHPQQMQVLQDLQQQVEQLKRRIDALEKHRHP